MPAAPSPRSPRPQSHFSFAGSRATTAALSQLVQAQDAVARGDDAEEVRRTTGWFVGPDDRWRHEISDHEATVNVPLLANLSSGGFAERAIKHVTYRKDADGTYQLMLVPESPKVTSDIVSMRGIPEFMLSSFLPRSTLQAMATGEGDEDYIGPGFDEAKRLPASFSFEGFNALPLDLVLSHKQLFQAYPELREILVQVDPKLRNGARLTATEYVDGSKRSIIAVGNPHHADVLSAVMHEVQHAIQAIEGFAPGGSASEFREHSLTAQLSRPINQKLQALMDRDPAFAALRRAHTRQWQHILSTFGRIDASGDAALNWDDVTEYLREEYFARMVELERFPEHFEYMDLEEERRRLHIDAPKLSAQEQYHRLAGEVEARNTQARLKLTPLARTLIPPGKTADLDAPAVQSRDSRHLSGPMTTVAALNAAISDLVANPGEMGNELGQVVATTSAEMRSKWSRLIGADARESAMASLAQGLYEEQTRTLFLIADNIPAGDELGVIAHELMHKHGRAVLGDAGWVSLHEAISRWAQAPLGTQERTIHDMAAQRVAASLKAPGSAQEHRAEEMFPYAVELAVNMGIKPSTTAQKDTAPGWLGRVRDALKSVWSVLSSKPKSLMAQDLVDLSFAIAQRERPDHNGELDAAVDGARAQGSHSAAAFAKWFGNSKAADENGKPLTLYHGTKAQFDHFDFKKIGQNGRAEGAGFYFTDNQKVASGYGETMQVHLSIQKPLLYDQKPFGLATTKKLVLRIAELEARSAGGAMSNGFLSNFGDIDYEGLDSVVRSAARLLVNEESALDQLSGLVGSGVSPEHVNQATFEITGHDGVITNGFSNEGDGSATIYVAFFPTQIKSANENNGEFDPNNPGIKFSLASTETSHVIKRPGKKDIVISSGYSDDTAIAMAGKRLIGKATAWEQSDGAFVILSSAVHPDYRRIGVARHLYDHIERAMGRSLSPAHSLSDDAFEFWKRYRPSAVAGDLRHMADQLVGRPASKNGHAGRITSASGRSATLTYENHPRGPRTHATLVGAEAINAALKAAGGEDLVPPHMAALNAASDLQGSRLRSIEIAAWERLKPEALASGIAQLEQGVEISRTSLIALLEEGQLPPNHPQFPRAEGCGAAERDNMRCRA